MQLAHHQRCPGDLVAQRKHLQAERPGVGALAMPLGAGPLPALRCVSPEAPLHAGAGRVESRASTKRRLLEPSLS
jgi:hypothetical protein